MPGICLLAGICLGSAWPPRSMALITRHMPGICLALDPSGTMPQVDRKCLEPGYGVSERLPLLHLQVGVDCEGEPLVLDMLPPPVAIAALAFHPCNWEAMHKRAAPVYGTVGEVDAWLQEAEYEDTAEDLGVKSATALLAMSKEALEAKSPRGAELHAALHDPACTLRSSMTRVYGHPFTCDKAIAAQEKVDAKPEQEGERNLNIQLGMGSDKTDISNVEGKWPQHLKLTNIELAHWFDRTSKVIRRRLRTWGTEAYAWHMPTADVVDVPLAARRPRRHPRGECQAAPRAVPPLPGCADDHPGGVCQARHQGAAQVTSPPPAPYTYPMRMPILCLAYAPAESMARGACGPSPGSSSATERSSA